MGVIVDSGMKAQIDQLEAKGALSLADTFRQANGVSLESLAFMTNVPAEYQDLVANSATGQAIRAERDEQTKEEDQEDKSSAERAAAYQRQIDENMLEFSVDGEDIQISQGDLRKVMEQRVTELEEQKKELQKSGGDPTKVRQIDNLLDEYRPEIEDLQNHKADPATMNTAQDLMKRDPKLVTEAKAMQNAANNSPGMSAATPQPSPVENASAAPASLKVAFVQSATPAASSSSPQPAPPVEQQKRQANNAFAAFS